MARALIPDGAPHLLAGASFGRAGREKEQAEPPLGRDHEGRDGAEAMD